MGHRVGEINSDHLAAGSDAFGSREKHRSAPSGNVEHACIGINARNIHEPSAKMSETCCP
jgi:hypothetical protein